MGSSHVCECVHTSNIHLNCIDKINNIAHTYKQNIQCIFIITSDLLCIYVYVLFIRNGHLEIVQFLVNGNHCQANAVNSYGKTALHYAAE